MYRELRHLDFNEQINLLESRGMSVDDKKRAQKKLENIGYYKLKEFAQPLSKVKEDELGNKVRRYDGVRFDSVLTRFYQDKNLRIYLMHAIEKIEISLKTKLAYILGAGSYGPFGYLSFSNWCNREKYCKYFLLDHQRKFKFRLREKVRLSNYGEIKDKSNQNEDGFPSIWLMIDVLTFGDVLELIDYMSMRNLNTLSNFYNCTPNELTSWLKCLKFIRNLCAHNSNVIDVKLKTTPIIKNDWKNILYKFEGKSDKYTDRLAVVLCIIKHFTNEINPTYHYDNISRSIYKIINKDEKNAQIIGFSNIAAYQKMFPFKKRTTTYKGKSSVKSR
ncbi:TPA: CAAX protease [Listeria monocytogenes]|uniref:Abi family protein n=1 Tax=Listeria marthii TaxID=529731 RepID=UPI0010F1D0EA|nr:Abi family protein [Listeria marthii]EAE6008238.1 CAAX protease [Listeria monocytogenes]EAF6052051.1 CAAX protease [Listeria monocytogenes]EAG1696469.1 CAAX protease [Listeria monocytogenes]EAG9348367.1 CAAX protease [Listeria monocytogenes]EDH0918639.1 CAAX protease [Listeria monocytogenes]